MKKLLLTLTLTLFTLSGCTQLITAPIAVAGSVADTAVSVVVPG